MGCPGQNRTTKHSDRSQGCEVTATTAAQRPTFTIVGEWTDRSIRALADLLLDAAEAEKRCSAGDGDTREPDEKEPQGCPSTRLGRSGRNFALGG